jgi:AraC-like DNA-binding protein
MDHMKAQKEGDPDSGGELARAKQHLLSRIDFWTRAGSVAPAIPGLWIYRHEAPSEPTRYTHQPSICLIAQGSKRIMLGSDDFSYDSDRYLVTSIDLPIVAQILEASKKKPYFGLAFRLDQKDIAQLLVDGNLPPQPQTKAARAMGVATLTLPLLNAFLRLLDLLDEPSAIPFLAPSIRREILYRILMNEAGEHLRQIGMMGSQNSQIRKAVERLKCDFTKTLSVEELAENSQMSLSAFHLHFRRLTAMSPLQYQKWLRLQEARRLMLIEDYDATRAAFGVGYESASQFSREYSRLFGVSPAKDIRGLRRSSGINNIINSP